MTQSGIKKRDDAINHVLKRYAEETQPTKTSKDREPKTAARKHHPKVEALTGILPVDFEEKKELTNGLLEKLAK